MHLLGQVHREDGKCNVEVRGLEPRTFPMSTGYSKPTELYFLGKNLPPATYGHLRGAKVTIILKTAIAVFRIIDNADGR